jgi:hypothetical protein
MVPLLEITLKKLFNLISLDVVMEGVFWAAYGPQANSYSYLNNPVYLHLWA